jgi:hypothetical protein
MAIQRGLPQSFQQHLASMASDTVPKPKRCPKCGWSKVWFVGFKRRRAVILSDAGGLQRVEVPVRDCRCAGCRARFRILPPFVYPHRQFGPDLMEAVLRQLLSDPVARPASFRGGDLGDGPTDRTVRRWLGWVREALGDIAYCLPAPPRSRKLAPPVRLAGGPAKLRALGGREKAEEVARIVELFGIWKSVAQNSGEDNGNAGLGMFLRWKWHNKEGLIVYLTKPPSAPPSFYPPDAA